MRETLFHGIGVLLAWLVAIGFLIAAAQSGSEAAQLVADATRGLINILFGIAGAAIDAAQQGF